MVRLDSLVSEVLGCTKKVAKARVEAGELAIAGEVQLEPRWQVVLGEAASVTLNGEPLLSVGPSRPFAHRFYLVNKPQRCLCERFRGSSQWCAARGFDGAAVQMTAKEAAARARGCTSIYDLVPEEHQHRELGVFGRLDVDTTGLILMGTDGGLQSLFMHPSCGCDKAYLATLRTEPHYRLRATAPEEFSRGMTLADGYECRPATLEVVESVADPAGGDEPFPRVVRVTLREGQYHQVKRMLGACGAAVCGLHRERFGGLSLRDYPALREGQLMPMTERELDILRSMLPTHRVAESDSGGREGAPRARGQAEGHGTPPPTQPQGAAVDGVSAAMKAVSVV